MKLWAIPCRATLDGRVMVESSDKTWSTGERNRKPPQYSCLENPMNSMKRLFSICSVSRLNIPLSLDNLQMVTEKKEFVNIFKTPDQEGNIGDSWIFLLPWMHCWMYSYKQSNSLERNKLSDSYILRPWENTHVKMSGKRLGILLPWNLNSQPLLEEWKDLYYKSSTPTLKAPTIRMAPKTPSSES